MIELAFEFDRLACVFLRIIERVHVPEAEIIVLDHDRIGIDIERERILEIIAKVDAVSCLVNDLRLAVERFDAASDREPVGLGRASVENDRVTVLDMLHDHRAHIVEVILIGLGVHHCDDLDGYPVLGRVHVKEILHLPDSVQLDDDLVGSVFRLQLLKICLVKLLLILDEHHVDVLLRESRNIVFLDALLADDQQQMILPDKLGILKCCSDKCGLSGL